MKKDFFSIGEISQITGITIKALRFYERIGLIKPSYKDPSTKYRYYSMEQYIQFEIIKASRVMGISPKNIKVMLDQRNNNTLLAFLSQQVENAARKISELQRTISLINTVKNNIQNSISSVANQDLYFKEIPLRTVITSKFDENANEKDLLIEYSNFYKQIDDNKLVNAYETGILFYPDDQGKFSPTHLFNAVIANEDSNISELSTIPSGRFLCVCYNKQNHQDQLAKLYSYLEQNKSNPILILQVDLLNDVFALDNQYVELQVLT
ncbi:MAG TPA: MerR family transcriptional regulator [Clostridia bacterium]|nr:MerR family transcriptional regulator [Clostridia bacterium]